MARPTKTKQVDRRDARQYAKRASEKYDDAVDLFNGSGSSHSVENLLFMACIHAADAICIAVRGEKSQGDDHAQAVRLLATVERAKDLAPKLQIALQMKSTGQYSVATTSTADLKKLIRITDALVARSQEIASTQ